MRDFFWSRFDAAEKDGINTIKEVAKSSFDEFKDDIDGLTMLVMVINHKSWAHHEHGNPELCELYADLYYQYYEQAIQYLEMESDEDDIMYFIRTLD